ncbi:tail needle knob protein, partial [Escherichia coli]|uniref:tail needle knob protein n=1 Tax=Escherichia coli TaxID=562 RepID=UPI003F67561F
CPLTDLGGKTCIFSHPVYLFLREFSLQDSRGGSNKTLFFKLSIVGTWPSGTANRSMQLTFSGSVPDTLVSSRNSATTTDNILLATFFSVDKDGFLATNGSTLTIQSNGAAFTATTIKIIAEQ